MKKGNTSYENEYFVISNHNWSVSYKTYMKTLVL